jgi:hypothetical protein
MGRPSKYRTPMSVNERVRNHRLRKRSELAPEELLWRAYRAQEAWAQAIHDLTLGVAGATEEFKSDETVTKWLAQGRIGEDEIEALKEISRDPWEARNAAWEIVGLYPFELIAAYMKGYDAVTELMQSRKELELLQDSNETEQDLLQDSNETEQTG